MGVHYLAQIHISKKEYDKASYYNGKLLGVREIYPRITQAIIETKQNPGEESDNLLNSIVYECIFEYSLAVAQRAPWLFEQEMYDIIIMEYTKAANIFEKFTDFGLLNHEISCCYEIAALDYAKKGMYDESLELLEKACKFSVKYDELDSASKHEKMPVAMLENESEFSSCKSMLQTLNLSERNDYNAIRETERYKTIIEKLAAHIE